MHIRYLFIDVISIYQILQGIYLIQQVMAFSVLYKIIPVIVAYDELEEDFELTTMRPWIFYEIHEEQGSLCRRCNLWYYHH